MKPLFRLFGYVAAVGSIGSGSVWAQSVAPPSKASITIASEAKVSPPKLPVGSEAQMKVVVSITAVGQPLTDILRTLSASSGVALKTPSYVGVQRMTLCVQNKPLYEVAGRIVETLSHQVNGQNHYYWEAATDNGALIYTLRPAASAALDLRRNLDQPRQEAIQTLIDKRTIAQLSPDARARYKSNLPSSTYINIATDPYAQALKTLSNSQFAAFLKTGTAKVRAARILLALEAGYKQAQKNPYLANSYVKAGDGPYKPPVEQISLRYFSVVDQEPNQYEYADPVLADYYGFQLGGIEKSFSFVYLNGYREKELGIGLLPETSDTPKEPQPVYDLTPFFQEKANSFSQRISVAYVLSALAQATGKSVYEEHYLRHGPIGLFGSSIVNTDPPRVMKGTLPQIVNSLCRTWAYQVTQAPNGDLVFWSRRWGRDKQADITENTLEPWRRNLKVNGHFTELDYRDMVQKLSYAQIKITLPGAFSFADEDALKSFLRDWQHQIYMARRIDDLLTPAEREAALSPDGIALANVSARQTILREVKFRSDAQIAAEKAGEAIPALTEEQLLQARIFLPKLDWKTMPQPELAVQRLGGLPYDPTKLQIKSVIGLHWQ